jgi:hypothetical protein
MISWPKLLPVMRLPSEDQNGRWLQDGTCFSDRAGPDCGGDIFGEEKTLLNPLNNIKKVKIKDIFSK